MEPRVVLVTGASRGIGRATALLLMRRGASVVGTARDEAELRSVGTEGGSKPGDWMPISMDVRMPESVSLAVEQVARRYDRLDVLINNAGIVTHGPIENLTLEAWNDILSTNLTGAFTCIREILPVMKEQNEGHIINVASHAGLYGLPNLTAYCASKFGLVGLSQSLGRELKARGVRVSCVCPPAVDTGMTGAFPADVSRAWSRVSPEHVANRIVEVIEAGYRHGRDGRMKRIARKVRRHRDGPVVVWNSWD